MKSSIEKCKESLNTCVQIIANLSLLLDPFVPFSSAKIRNILRIEKAAWHCIEVPASLELGQVEILFDRIDKKVIQDEEVIDFLQERYPLLIRNTQRFYVCTYNDVYECGVECGDGFKLPNDSGLEIMRIPAGRYAVLSDDRLGDLRMGSTKIDLWLTNNSITHENVSVFAVYETLNGKYDNEHIHMKLYKRLK